MLRRTAGPSAFHSDAGVAQAADLDLDPLLADGAGRLGPGHRVLEIGQALDGAALGAHEMWVCRRLVVAGDRLETPDVVADIGAVRQADVREVGQVAVDRRRVPRLRGELGHDLTVRDR